MKSPRTSRLIAILGGSGAGKTWLADQPQKAIGNDADRLSPDNKHPGGDL